jgi:hypothetical protein
MTLIAGQELVARRFFSRGTGVYRGSSIDLTIGEIIGGDGRPVDDPFVLKPGEIVQVVSAEVFQLPANVTGHVTYKTTLTHSGIWALTVGIVDPGWSGPVTTTLLNFSKLDHPIHRGDEFLRVSFFEHHEVDQDALMPPVVLEAYMRSQRKAAVSNFPKAFLDQHRVSEEAAKRIFSKFREQAIIWVTFIAIVLGLSQYVADFGAFRFETAQGVNWEEANSAIKDLTSQVKELQSQIESLRQQRPPTPSAVAN